MAMPIEDITYRFTFDERDNAGEQRYIVRLHQGCRCCGSGMRPALSSRREQLARPLTTAAGLRVWAGKAGDPFWIEPDVLHAVGHAFQDGTS